MQTLPLKNFEIIADSPETAAAARAVEGLLTDLRYALDDRDLEGIISVIGELQANCATLVEADSSRATQLTEKVRRALADPEIAMLGIRSNLDQILESAKKPESEPKESQKKTLVRARL